jgi:hypothetical protein
MTTERSPERVLLGIPCGNGWLHYQCCEAAWGAHGHDGPVMIGVECGSLLAHTFNRLLGHARAQWRIKGIDAFAMLHNDIVPAHEWLKTLLSERRRLNADVVSAVVAIKDEKGLTSTACGNPADPFDFRRITTTELKQLPETFSIDDCRKAFSWVRSADCLLVNTGCWVTDFTHDFWHATTDNVYDFRFSIDDRQQCVDGVPVTECSPEDWMWSREMSRAGCRVYATRKFVTWHATTTLFGTHTNWGSVTDLDGENFRRQYGRRPATEV